MSGRPTSMQKVRVAALQRVPTIFGKQRAADAAILFRQRHDAILCASGAVHFKCHCLGDDLCKCLHHLHDVFHAGIEVSQTAGTRVVSASLRLVSTHGQTLHGLSWKRDLVPIAMGGLVASVAARARRRAAASIAVCWERLGRDSSHTVENQR